MGQSDQKKITRGGRDGVDGEKMRERKEMRKATEERRGDEREESRQHRSGLVIYGMVWS